MNFLFEMKKKVLPGTDGLFLKAQFSTLIIAALQCLLV
jgi:hypothetical protein